MKKLRVKRLLRHETLEDRKLLDAGGLAAAGEPVGDFQLIDVNATSPSFNQGVSPRDFQGQASAWYFIHST